MLLSAFIGNGAFAQSAGEPAESPQNLPFADYKSGQKKYIVNNIKVYGVENHDHTLLTSIAGIRKGDEVYLPGNYISQAIRSFWNRRYFADVEVVAQMAGDSVNFEIYMMERPMIYNWDFKGVRKGEATTLRNDLELKQGHELSDFVINKNINLIKKKYIDKGFRNVTVDTKIENDTTYNNAAKVTFIINKGHRVKIGEIKFDGNEVFSDKRLRGTLKKTHQTGWNIFQSTKLKDSEYENDKENIIDFYNARGYRNANIISDSIYDINSKRIGIAMDIEEGNKYFFRNITWVGNSVYSTDQLQAMLGIHGGDIYDKKSLHKRLGIGKEANPDAESISSMYQNNGYLFSRINPTEIIIGEDSIDLEIKIFEGKQAYINEVKITGNHKVNDEVIRRELYTRPGDLYDRSLIMMTLRQLAQMQHFNPEAISPEPVPINGEATDIIWSLEEKASDKAEISGGWGAGMFVGSIGLQLNNLSTRNFFKKGAWRPYPQGQNQQLAINARSNGSYYKSFGISFTEPWLGGKKPTSLTVSTQYADQTDASYFWQGGNKHFRTLGVDVGIGRRLSWPDQYFTIYNSISYQLYSLKDWDYFILQNGNAHIFALNTVFGRNSVDNPIYPRNGSDFSLAITLTPPYSLFDNKDYSDKNMPDNERYKWIEYHKWKFKGQWFHPLSNNTHTLVLMARAEFGYLGSYNKNKPSPFEGFDVGGDGMSGYNLYGVDIIGVRGYDNSTLTPLSTTNTYASAYNKYTLELRYPFILKPSSTIYGLVFAEGGNAFSSWKTFNPFQVKRSVGIGVRLFLPIVGMLGVDWGYGFDKVPGSNKKHGGQIHYMIGTQF